LPDGLIASDLGFGTALPEPTLAMIVGLNLTA
jgi:hypothetical protein